MIYEQDGFNRIDNLVYEEQPGRIGNVAYSDSLEHHGIAGQKWGVRHGPPYPLVSGGKNVHLNVGKMTEKTKQAYKKTKAKVGGVVAARKQKAAAKKAEKENEAKNISDVGPKKFVKSKQRISDMSSEELKARIERLKLEEEYRKYLNGGATQQKMAAKGKNGVDTFLDAYGNSTFKKVADTLLVGVAKGGVELASKALVNKIDRNNLVKKNRIEALKKAQEEERQERRNAEKEERDRYNKYRDTFNTKYYEKMAEAKAKQDADEWWRNYTANRARL